MTQNINNKPHTSSRILLRRYALAILAISLFAVPAMPVLAATINVTTTAQTSARTCTLSNAIRAANTNSVAGACPAGAAGPGPDTIVLPANSTFSFTAPQGDADNALPSFSSEIVVQGNGSTIRRDPAAPTTFRILRVVSGGNLTVRESTISGGVADGASENLLDTGGGIRVESGGRLHLTDSTITGNSANYGGGIFCALESFLWVESSTVSQNSAIGDGGGINVNNSCQADIVNSTISGNSAYAGAGLLMIGAGEFQPLGIAYIADSTITNNVSSGPHAGGVSVINRGTSATLTRTIVSGNRATDPQAAAEVGGTVTANSFNLFGHGGVSSANAFGGGFAPGADDLNATSDGLSIPPPDIFDIQLADNSGRTLTHALVSNSPAVDAAGGACSPTDQRGITRPQGAACDIGAFELSPDYSATVLPPINATGPVSTFKARRDQIPVGFSLKLDGVSTCDLPQQAKIRLTKTVGTPPGVVPVAMYQPASETADNFRVVDCKYAYTVSAKLLTAGTYTVELLIDGLSVGSGTFKLK